MFRFDLLLLGIAEIMQFNVLLYMLIGVVGGIVLAAIPGFTITMAVILVLPFTFGMAPIEGIATMVAVYVGGMSGGLITAALIGIPGTPSAVATTFDGHPMVKNGEPGKALAIGIWASTFGSFLSMLIMVTVAPQIADFALQMGAWEYFSLIVFALTIVASLTGDSFLKGIISALIGLLIAAIGVDPMTAVSRFTFGFGFLNAGVEFLVVLIGVYAASQLYKELEFSPDEKTKKADEGLVTGDISLDILSSLKTVISQPKNLIRSSILGTIVGALPGAGGSIANIVAYDQARKGSDTQPAEKFGTGIPDGVVASEAGNNSTAGGALIPTIALGIPGGAITAVMMAALMVHGMNPGPMLIENEPAMVGSIFVGFFISTLLMLMVQIIGARLFLRVSTLPKYIMIPSVLSLCAVGSYVLNSRITDIYLLFIIGVLGYLFQKFDFARAPLILGVILGPIGETNLRRALMHDPDVTLFFTRPISLFFLILAVISMIYSVRQQQSLKGGLAEDE
ncbi:tripartite tricarboxylate transporter permease [Halarsenatibacter silvermanii]|uniref:Putative tricarboxylic transport membrane protein n=1 Tax=Halarsenatibacter silvermanii TaxID=321763 RepID=A0A1G9RJT6_9FIRM|nr:tripartite tricarboxylate transporter permease [Halarsenatibacter silvermanii]SDM23320.1 putative tricarboxylic transport membrane protein [Halarsenatibacter silvermanii]